jgi:hypothetical protein
MEEKAFYRDERGYNDTLLVILKRKREPLGKRFPRGFCSEEVMRKRGRDKLGDVCECVIRALSLFFFVEKRAPVSPLKTRFSSIRSLLACLFHRKPFPSPRRVVRSSPSLSVRFFFSRARAEGGEKLAFLAEEGRKKRLVRLFFPSSPSCPTTTRKCPPRCKT